MRLLTYLLPAVLCGALATVMVELIPTPANAAATLLVMALVLGVTTTLLALLDVVMRQFLPLAFLLRLSLAFPGQAPSRYAVARRAGRIGNIRELLDEEDEDVSRAAERLLVLVAALSRHDRATRGHAERVRVYADLIADEMELPDRDRDRMRWVALLHDIGKLHVPSRVLNKAERPNKREWELLHAHPSLGGHVASPLADHLGDWFVTIEQHHERWDGGGYPHGLSGEDICLGARIVAVADAYEVMTAVRSYQRPVSAVAARDELVACSGSQFDPKVVRAFLHVSVPRLRWIVGPLAVAAQVPALSRIGSRMGALGADTARVAAASVGAVAVAVGGGAAVVGQLQMGPALAMEPDAWGQDDREPREETAVARTADTPTRAAPRVATTESPRSVPPAVADAATPPPRPDPRPSPSSSDAPAPPAPPEGPVPSAPAASGASPSVPASPPPEASSADLLTDDDTPPAGPSNAVRPDVGDLLTEVPTVEPQPVQPPDDTESDDPDDGNDSDDTDSDDTDSDDPDDSDDSDDPDDGNDADDSDSDDTDSDDSDDSDSDSDDSDDTDDADE